jgi:hypothetical protein
MVDVDKFRMIAISSVCGSRKVKYNIHPPAYRQQSLKINPRNLIAKPVWIDEHRTNGVFWLDSMLPEYVRNATAKLSVVSSKYITVVVVFESVTKLGSSIAIHIHRKHQVFVIDR